MEAETAGLSANFPPGKEIIMDINVVYYSKTGHSKTIARAAAQALSLEAADLSRLDAPPQCDLLFLVSGIYGGVADPKTTAFVETLTRENVGRVCLMTTSMGQKPQTELRTLLENKGIPVLRGEYTCKGSFLFFGLGHPSRTEISGAGEFARRTVESL